MAQGGATATVSATATSLDGSDLFTMASASFLPISLTPEHGQRRRDDLVALQAELALQLLERSGSTEGLHADDPAMVADIALPTQRRCLLDGKPRLDGGRQHFLAIGLRLVLEDVPLGHLDDGRTDPLGQHGLVRF